MHRRHYLALTGAGLTGLAGCAGTSSQPTASATPTPSPTATSTPVPATFRVEAIEAPSPIKTGEQFRLRVRVTNTGDQPGVFETRLNIEAAEGQVSEDGSISLAVDPGETATWESDQVSFPRAVTVTYSLPEYGRHTQQKVQPASTRPEVIFANLVTEWNTFGDVEENEISSARAGEYATVGFRHHYYLHEGTYHIFEQCDVYDASDDRIGSQTFEDEQIFEGSGYSEFEHALSFDTRGWGSGTYTAYVRVRDEVTNEVSRPLDFSFKLT